MPNMPNALSHGKIPSKGMVRIPISTNPIFKEAGLSVSIMHCFEICGIFARSIGHAHKCSCTLYVLLILPN